MPYKLCLFSMCAVDNKFLYVTGGVDSIPMFTGDCKRNSAESD